MVFEVGLGVGVENGDGALRVEERDVERGDGRRWKEYGRWKWFYLDVFF